ncbi:MAG: protein translocase subunit SecF [Treponema sp.]|jgi:preprotein translocase subunit SecF|nr:protein translocase subunit SecF [Treponema sp.]
MKRIIPFSRYFLHAAILSTVLIVIGLIGYVVKGGFNNGVDFQAGLIQEIRFAPTAFNISYSGFGNASVSLSRNRLDIVLSGSGVNAETRAFPFADYPTLDSLIQGLSAITGIQATLFSPGDVSTSILVQSAQSDSQLGVAPFVVHYLPPNAEVIPIEDVRAALQPLGTVSVQVLGQPSDRHFMIRMDASEVNSKEGVPAEKIVAALEERFGKGGVAVTRADFVGSRFSKQLTQQAGLLLALTLFLILAYASIRFKPQFAIGAVLAIIHDMLIMVTFIIWTRMEFNTTTIAAILTILGYSINDTIVIFDRIRETTRVYPNDSLENILNRAVSETLGRTIITTVTTMLAVLSLFIFTSGSMRDFALALLVGMVSGVYSTIFIAVGFVNFWDIQTKKSVKKKLAPAPIMPVKTKRA